MKRRMWIAALVVAGAIGWYLFRPEGPTTSPALRAGHFHSVAHETRGTATVQDLGNGRRVLRLTDFATSNGPDLWCRRFGINFATAPLAPAA